MQFVYSFLAGVALALPILLYPFAFWKLAVFLEKDDTWVPEGPIWFFFPYIVLVLILLLLGAVTILGAWVLVFLGVF